MTKVKKVGLQRPRRGPLDWYKRHRLGLGLVVIVLILGLGAMFLVEGRRSSPLTAPVGLDKSKGDANAPVTVVEYGDFQ